MYRTSSVLLALLLGTTLSHAAARKMTVTVEAGDFDRPATVVTVAMPAMAERPNAVVIDGQTVPLQFPPGASNASFSIGGLRKGARAAYALTNVLEMRVRSELRATREERKVVLKRQRNYPLSFRVTEVVSPVSLLEYQAEPGPFPREDIKELFRRGAYLHPIHTLSGRAVTDDFPPNHIHHHGVWWSWTKTDFDSRAPDFWNMGDSKGRVDFVTLESQWTGPVHAGFSSRHRFVDLTGPKQVAALYENWEVTAYVPNHDKGYWLFDLVSEQRCATTNTFKLPEYHYGGLGLRGNWAWNGKTNVNFLTADGETDRVKGNTQKARWCDMWGRIDGADCGIAILCHPSNFRAPQPMRVHPSEPFFCYAPQQGGDMEIKPGETYVSRYRFVVHDGVMAKAELDRLWNDYAHPPVVKLKIE